MYGLFPIRAQVLAAKMIPNVNWFLRERWELRAEQSSIGMLTLNIDDVGYVAIDEATKKANVEVVYAESFYAGAAHASGPLSGEFIGIIAGPNPAEVKTGLDVAIQFAEEQTCFWSADEKGEIFFYAECIAKTGSYLAKEAGIERGASLAYLVGQPIETLYGLDKALKAAEVEMVSFFEPPSPTNCAGAFLTGTQSACKAACDAFAAAVVEVARHPKRY